MVRMCYNTGNQISDQGCCSSWAINLRMDESTVQYVVVADMERLRHQARRQQP